MTRQSKIFCLQNMSLDSDVHRRTRIEEEMENEGSDEKASSIHAEFAPPNEATKTGKTTGLIWKTHLNVALYSCCFWIQLGVLPVWFTLSIICRGKSIY